MVHDLGARSVANATDVSALWPNWSHRGHCTRHFAGEPSGSETDHNLRLQTSLGVIFYSTIFFATDLLGERHGRAAAQQAVLAGFGVSVIIVLMLSISMLYLPSTEPESAVFSRDIHAAFAEGRHLWLRNNLSTLSSQAMDTVLYSLIVWWGTVSLGVAIKLGLAKYLFKVIIAAGDTPFIYWARGWQIPSVPDELASHAPRDVSVPHSSRSYKSVAQ